MESFDVVVIGGGTAGPVAAIQAGRAGAETLLVEKEGILGGTMITAAVNAPASFCSYNTQIIGGIGWELVRDTLRETGEDPAHALKADRKGGIRHVTIDRAIYAALADRAVLEAPATLLLHAMPASAQPLADGWSLTLATKTGLREIHARTLVDCTGDANVVTLAGLKVRRPETRQPGTLVVRLEGYDADALDVSAIQQAFDAEVSAGRLCKSDTGWYGGSVGPVLHGHGGNCIHVAGIDGSTSESKTHAEVEARRVLLRLLRFFRTQPGLEGMRATFLATECGIRETVTIHGRAFITEEDYVSGRLWDDAICYSHYSIDIHETDGLTYRTVAPGAVPTIPLGAMLPEGAERLIVAGRCISGDHEANSAYRVASTCMAAGQAAGAAAALAARTGRDIANVPLDDLRNLLAEHGAIVPHLHPLTSAG